MRARLSGNPSWLRDGIVTPRHLLARGSSRLPRSGRLLWRLPAGSRSVALTFDDGPDPAATPVVLRLLAEHGANASFFVLTEHLRRRAGLVREAAANGHHIGLHGDRHEDLTQMSTVTSAQRLLDARRRLEDVVQEPVVLYRPPFGRTSRSLLRAAGRAGLDAALWSRDPRDWAPDDRFPLTARLVRCMQPGAVVLLHDRFHGTAFEPGPGALATALSSARDRGLSLCALGSCGALPPFDHHPHPGGLGARPTPRSQPPPAA